MVDDHSVHEIVLGKDPSADPLSEALPEVAKTAELRTKLASFPERTPVDALTGEIVSEWSENPENGIAGIGAILLFEKKEADEEGPEISFVVEMRTHPSVREGSDVVRAEIAFGGYDEAGSVSYHQATVPLPLLVRGRRKLFMTFSEPGTNSPLKVPKNVAAAFREKFLTKIEVLHYKPKSKGIIGIVSKAVGKVVGK